MSFIREFWEFLKERKKYWLLPIIIVLVIFGGLIILALLNSKILTPLNKIWFKIGIILGKIISPFIMGIIFFSYF